MRMVLKEWGREEILVSTELYTLKRMVLDPGAACSFHRHAVKDETFFVESGSMVIEVGPNGDESSVKAFPLRRGDTCRIRPGWWHRFTGDSAGCQFMEVSTKDSPDDSYRAAKSRHGGYATETNADTGPYPEGGTGDCQ